MSRADYNRAVYDCAYLVSQTANRAAAMPCSSPAQMREVAAMLTEIAELIGALKLGAKE